MSHGIAMDILLMLLLVLLVLSPALALWHADRLAKQLAAALEDVRRWTQEARDLRIERDRLRIERDAARSDLDESEIRLDEARRLAEARQEPPKEQS